MPTTTTREQDKNEETIEPIPINEDEYFNSRKKANKTPYQK
jgi:hypothetical protein